MATTTAGAGSSVRHGTMHAMTTTTTTTTAAGPAAGSEICMFRIHETVLLEVRGHKILPQCKTAAPAMTSTNPGGLDATGNRKRRPPQHHQPLTARKSDAAVGSGGGHQVLHNGKAAATRRRASVGDGKVRTQRVRSFEDSSSAGGTGGDQTPGGVTINNVKLVEHQGGGGAGGGSASSNTNGDTTKIINAQIAYGVNDADHSLIEDPCFGMSYYV